MITVERSPRRVQDSRKLKPTDHDKLVGAVLVGLVLEVQRVIPLEQTVVQAEVDVRLAANCGCQVTCRRNGAMVSDMQSRTFT